MEEIRRKKERQTRDVRNPRHVNVCSHLSLFFFFFCIFSLGCVKMYYDFVVWYTNCINEVGSSLTGLLLLNVTSLFFTF